MLDRNRLLIAAIVGLTAGPGIAIAVIVGPVLVERIQRENAQRAEREAILAKGPPLIVTGPGKLADSKPVRGGYICAVWPGNKDRNDAPNWKASSRFSLVDARGRVFQADASANFNPGGQTQPKFVRCMGIPGRAGDATAGGPFVAAVGKATFQERIEYCHVRYSDLCLPVNTPRVTFTITN